MADALDSPITERDGSVVTFINFDAPFSNYTSHKIVIWGQKFSSVEHALQYYKYKDSTPKWALRIKRAKSASEARRLGKSSG